MRQGIWGLTLLAALGTGLVAGVFFAFSNFIMKALATVPADHAISVMQSINITVINPFFMTILFGSAAACGGLFIFALRSLRQPGSGWLISGSILYVVGSILVTAIFNVPLNDRLAAIHSGTAAGTQQWAAYLQRLDSLEPRSRDLRVTGKRGSCRRALPPQSCRLRRS